MPWTNFIKYAISVILLGSAVLVACFYAHNKDKQAAISAIKLEYAKELTKQQELFRKKEQELVANSNALRNKKDEELASVNHRANDAMRLLAARKSRPTKLPTITETRETCTGAFLYREDAEFLTREAATAEGVRIERDYYYEQYESARKSLAGENENARPIGEALNSKPVP